ncbi:hypothetical protein BC829DRAFT_447560, partial [Chytridium lagenaria]
YLLHDDFHYPLLPSTTINLSAIRTSWLVEPRETPASVELRRRSLKTSNVKPAHVSQERWTNGFWRGVYFYTTCSWQKLTYAAAVTSHAKLPMLMKR